MWHVLDRPGDRVSSGGLSSLQQRIAGGATRSGRQAIDSQQERAVVRSQRVYSRVYLSTCDELRDQLRHPRLHCKQVPTPGSFTDANCVYSPQAVSLQLNLRGDAAPAERSAGQQ